MNDVIITSINREAFDKLLYLAKKKDKKNFNKFLKRVQDELEQVHFEED